MAGREGLLGWVGPGWRKQRGGAGGEGRVAFLGRNALLSLC